MFTTNRWIAFWFSLLIFDFFTVVATGGTEPSSLSDTLKLVTVWLTAWCFMYGFLEAFRPQKQQASQESTPVGQTTHQKEC